MQIRKLNILIIIFSIIFSSFDPRLSGVHLRPPFIYHLPFTIYHYRLPMTIHPTPDS